MVRLRYMGFFAVFGRIPKRLSFGKFGKSALIIPNTSS